MPLGSPSLGEPILKRLFLDSRGVYLPRAYNSICTSLHHLEVIIFQEPYQRHTRFRCTGEHKTLESNKSLLRYPYQAGRASARIAGPALLSLHTFLCLRLRQHAAHERQQRVQGVEPGHLVGGQMLDTAFP
jgi:hypothetical protein